MIEVKGKAGIVARVICDSVSEADIRLTTFEIETPRIVWAEFLTHGMLCRNAASSRAIPFEKMQEQLTGQPVRFGKANKGMCDAGEHDTLINGLYTPEEWWHLSKLSASKFSEGYYEAGYAKQIYNRLTETYQTIKAVVSMTEFDNFNWLRNHSAADPTLEDLAHCMWEARQQSVPQLLKAGEYHLPYVDCEFTFNDDTQMREQKFIVYDENDGGNGFFVTLEDAIKVSCARTAAVSFRAEDYGLEQCLRVYDRLIGDERKHASAMQHAATPMAAEMIDYDAHYNDDDYSLSVNVVDVPSTWQKGISHMDRDGQLWSAQYRGWIMHRKTIAGENYTASQM